MTVLEHLLSVLHDAAIYNRHDLAKPSVILWTDGDRHWQKIAPLIAAARGGFYVLNPDGPGEFSGSSTWIRYQLGKWQGDEVPVVYLPGIYRHQFRGAAGFPASALHLYALQFLGQFCCQINGKDWTPTALLAAEDGGLGLKVAQDKATKDALAEQLSAVMLTQVKELRGRHLEAADFHALAVGDPVRLLLEWMAAPDACALKNQPGQWAALISYSKKELGFDPEKDGRLIALEKFTMEAGKWNEIWKRYEEAPLSYPGLRQGLDLIQPKDLFSQSNLRIPANNARQEAELRKGLMGLAQLPTAEARTSLSDLVKRNADRLKTLWAKLEEAPLALATAHLGRMLDAMQQGLLGHDFATWAESYLSHAWQVDLEARKAWSCAKQNDDSQAITSALKATYEPWLQELAHRVQSQSQNYPLKSRAQAIEHRVEPGTVILFVDGLRADVAMELKQRLESFAIQLESRPQWSALPTVTATAKPAWHPLASQLAGTEQSENFEPSIKETEKPCRTAEFRKLITQVGWKWFDASECGDPSQAGWTEVGSFDRYGHDQGAKMVWRIEEEISAVHQRIQELIRFGWKKIRVITDHGWLWLPGGLPKVDLPSHLTVSKWGRCACPDPHSQQTFEQVPWFWGNEHSIVLAPGISVFHKGVEYSHGGLTLQEALTLQLDIIIQNEEGQPLVEITATKWVGLRLRIELTGADVGMRADIRRRAADASSSLMAADDVSRSKGPDSDGRISLVIEDDSLAGEAAILVILRNGQIIAKQTITIAEN